ncbi:LLM class flavin-dependent oxidoreductase [Myroides odoratimimus subsp. xuanwuensis]
MEPDLTGEVLEAWARAIDEGPFASLAFGERMAFDNPESLTLLGACAAWTRRVRLVTTVIVPQLHDPVMLAKALATGDVISGGRLTVGLGVGGRDEDYAAVGADLAWRSRRDTAERVAVMRSVWAGEQVVDACRPVGPLPVQPGGPPLLIGAVGPKSIRSAAAWADGIAGITMDLDMGVVERTFEQVRAAWAEAGRPAPRLTTSLWFALDDVPGDGVPGEGRARAQVDRHLRRYFNWIDPALVEAMLPTTGFAGTGDELLAVLKQLEALGADEVQLIPTGSDVEQVRRVAALLG